MLPAYYIPSNWILLWYILYMVGLVNYNPKLAILLGILFNVVTLSVMAYYKAFIQNIIYLATFVFFLKCIPLWTIRNTTLKDSDVYATIVFFIVYIAWILWQKKTMDLVNALKGLLHNKMETHGMLMLQKWFG
jgi:hypothetical protein